MAKILIDVQGGLVHEVYVVNDGAPEVHIYRINWDSVESGEGGSPWSEWNPVAISERELQARLQEADYGYSIRHGFGDDCSHNWISAVNEVVARGEVCTKCGAIRAEPDEEC